MKSRVIALAVGVCASFPAMGWAEEVQADLGGVMAPVGPEGTTVVRVERSLVAGARYAIVRTREPGGASRCGVPTERVSAWTQVDGRWVEALNEVFDRCPADRRPGLALVVRARVKTRPGRQWRVGRIYNERIKVAFDRAGIEIPYPHRVEIQKRVETARLPEPPEPPEGQPARG